MRSLLLLPILLLALTFTARAAPAETPISYHSPRAGATSAPAGTSIAVRATSALDPSSVRPERFTITGGQSGPHGGRVTLASDGRTAILDPASPFTPGELVSVLVGPGLRTEGGAPVASLAFSFIVSRKGLDAYANSALSLDGDRPQLREAATGATLSYVTVPGLFPAPSIITATTQVAPGYLFLAPFNFSPPDHIPSALMIVDNTGEPVFLQSLPLGADGHNFRRHENGTLSYFSTERKGFVVLDSAYRELRLIQAGNGYADETDNHELLFLPNGNILLMVYDSNPRDLSAIGGLASATVVDTVIQELDPQGNVVFEWNSADYMEVTDTYAPIANVPVVDYVHGNAIEPDSDGNLLLSNRNTADILKIDRESGEVIWHLGGKKNQFTFVNDQGFYFQHDIRRLPSGNISLFDNRTERSPVRSRAVEYVLDEEGKTARLVWAFTMPWPYTYSVAMGNAQPLPNGSRLISWGTGYPTLTEVTAGGQIAFSLSFLSPDVTYRAYRFPWVGAPLDPPVAVARSEEGVAVVYMSWNGSTEVAAWRVEGSWYPGELEELAMVPRSGFETRVALPQATAQTCFFRVTALDVRGAALRSSAIERRDTAYCASVAPTKLFLPEVP
ncbi:MAG: hypothetical protein HGA45_08430 [Chloroflexales bacterium]|nr:hypothetical protein [Chloroflexales bacterium]